MYSLACHYDKTWTTAFFENNLNSPNAYLVHRVLLSDSVCLNNVCWVELAQSQSSTREQRLTAVLALCALFDLRCDVAFPDE